MSEVIQKNVTTVSTVVVMADVCADMVSVDKWMYQLGWTALVWM